MSSPVPLLDQRVGAMYRVRLYPGTQDCSPLVAVAEPLVEQRSVAGAAALLWERHVAPHAHSLDWFEVLDARRVSDARVPLVARLRITLDAAGQPQLCGWRRVSWREVERCCGGRIAVERLGRPLPARVPQAGPPSEALPAPVEAARPRAAMRATRAPWWGRRAVRGAVGPLNADLLCEPAP